MRKSIALITLLFCVKVNNGELNSFIVWNVGQGQWTTLVTVTTCYHFDMGGEKAPLRSISAICFKKKNEILISHADWDHINFLKFAPNILSSICMRASPLGDLHGIKKKLLATVPNCKIIWPNSIFELTSTNQIMHLKRSNDRSRVFLILNRILVCGDSPTSQEKIWSQRIPNNLKNAILVLGHHGSRTSTSSLLLDNIPHLNHAVASARTHRYGHPHQDAILRLKIKGTSVIKTEDWGSIHFEL